VPTQISLEDSYIHMDTLDQVRKELLSLSLSLVKRMHIDLTESPEHAEGRRWLAIPQTLRLTTRPRPPVGPDGRRPRTFQRISRSGPMPTFVLSRSESDEAVAARLATEALMPMFKKLHPEKSGWNLSLINVAATNMQETAIGDGGSTGRDIGTMFRQQKRVLKQWQIEDKDVPPDGPPDEPEAHPVASAIETTLSASVNDASNTNDPVPDSTPTRPSSPRSDAERGIFPLPKTGSEDFIAPTQSTFAGEDDEASWQSDESLSEAMGETCPICDASMPAFAFEAHLRYHEMDTD
jgi:DNA polymerase iota